MRAGQDQLAKFDVEGNPIVDRTLEELPLGRVIDIIDGGQ